MKRTMMILSIILLAIAVLAGLFVSQPAFGRNPRGARLERVKLSPYYKDGQFQKDEPTELMTGEHSMWSSVIDMLTGRKKSPRCVPTEGEVPVVKSDLKNLSYDR